MSFCLLSHDMQRIIEAWKNCAFDDEYINGCVLGISEIFPVCRDSFWDHEVQHEIQILW